jgi:hypothetical protein
MLELVVQKAAGETEIMPAKVPNTSKQRRPLLQPPEDLPSKDREMFRDAAGPLRWLTILWDLEELDPDPMPSIPEKRHILLAYKILQILWFNKLLERSNQASTKYVRDRIADDQNPEGINETFARSADELVDLCKVMSRPKWVKIPR